MITPIRAVVCTNRPAAASADCLTALIAEQVEVIVVVSGGDAGVAQAYRDAIGVAPAELTILAEPRPGLARARNRALAHCGDQDVLAFVDDDAIVGDGWLAAMHAAWQRAPEPTACIGGPIRPRFAGERPRWLSDDLLVVLTALDYGPQPLELDPFVTTVYGANISFRVGPLRGVGGFDPAFGHVGRRTGFGEEDEAERALARAGYGVRYDPGPWVWHEVAADRLVRRAFLARRMAYGAVLGARGGRTRRRALRQALSSGVGAPLAAARGDERLAMERATRLAENVGVLLAPLAARR